MVEKSVTCHLYDKSKTYTYPYGATINVQCYEPFLLDILVANGYTHQDIITKRNEVPVIWYTYKNDKKK